jgi:hypothetical protein
VTKSPKDDQPLIDFLRQNVGTPPPAAPNLEVQIMQAVVSSPHQQTSRRRHLWVVPPALAASLLLAWATYRAFVPPSPLPDTIEAFMTDNWDSVVAGDETEVDWFSVH